MAHATTIDQLRRANEKLVAALTKLAEDRTMKDLITECLTEALGLLDGRSVTEEMVNNAASKVAEKFTERMFRFESRTRVEPPPDLLSPG